MPSIFRDPPRLPLVAPSILSADFARMGEECASVLCDRAGGRGGAEGADLLHLDVMDGHFVPNLTMGPDLCRALRDDFPDAMLDVHLMVTDPGQYIAPFADAGADHITFHVEPAVGVYKSMGKPEGPARYDPEDLIRQIHARGMTAGIAINPPTHPDTALPWIPAADLVLVMSVNPGYSGQKFIEPTLDTTRAVSSMLRPDQRLQMDGGITPATASGAREAGCDVLVAASAIFSRIPWERPGVIAELRGGRG